MEYTNKKMKKSTLDWWNNLTDKERFRIIEEARPIAESNRIISNSITPEYLKWKFIEALSNSGANVIYVPTEANLPILEAKRLSVNEWKIFRDISGAIGDWRDHTRDSYYSFILSLSLSMT